MPFETFDYGGVLNNVEQIQGSRNRNALYAKQSAQIDAETQRNALIRQYQGAALNGDQNAMGQLQSVDPSGSLDFQKSLRGEELAAVETLSRAAQQVTASKSPAAMARFVVQSPMIRQAAKVAGLDIDKLALDGDDDAIRAGATELLGYTQALTQPPPQQPGFSLKPGETRFDGQGNPIASVKPTNALNATDRLYVQDDLARRRDAEQREFTAAENEKSRTGAIEKDKAKADNALLKQTKQREMALAQYEAARTGLMQGLEGSATGPFVGRLPAVTSKQQIAEGSVAAMAPILKSLFRVAGEGTFTDRDQSLLLEMLPKRTDQPEARDAKLANIDAIVRAKLTQQAPAGGDVAPSTALKLPPGWTGTVE